MFTPSAPITIPPMVSVFTKGIGWVGEDFGSSAPASATGPSADTAHYYPILLPSSCVVKRVWWANGSDTTGGAETHVGIYADSGSYSPGAKCVSGSAYQGTVNEIQFVDVTDTFLPPGLYWLAIVTSSAVNRTFFRSFLSTANAMEASRVFSQTNARPLPATATPAEEATNDNYLCGFSTTSGTTDVPAPPSMVSVPAPITIPPMVSVFIKGIGWMAEDLSATAPASAAYDSGGRAAYVPLLLPSSCIVKRVWWANGATVSGGATIECGIYADSGSFSPGAKVVSGSAVQGNATEVQFVDVTDTSLPPGLYWLAVVASTATNTTLFRVAVGSGSTIDSAFRFNEAGASPLPSTATPAEAADQSIWLCGFSTTSSP